jgi:hypothetical protein
MNSESIVIEGMIPGPPDKNPAPFRFFLVLDVRGPNGTTVFKHRSKLLCLETEPLRVKFSVRADVLRPFPGDHTVSVWMEERDDPLAWATIRVARRGFAWEDLRVVSRSLVCERYGNLERGTVVFADGGASFEALLKPRDFHIERCRGVRARIDVECPATGYRNTGPWRILDESGGELRVSEKIPEPLGPPGTRIVRLFLEEREAASLEFEVTNEKDAAKRLEVSNFELTGLDTSGRPFAVDGTVFLSQTLYLRPVITLQTPYPSGLVSYPVTVLMTLDGQEVHHQVSLCTLRHPVETFPLEDIPLHGISLGGTSAKVLVLVFVEDRLLTRRKILLRAELPPFADVQRILIEAEQLRSSKGKRGRSKGARDKGQPIDAGPVRRMLP